MKKVVLAACCLACAGCLSTGSKADERQSQYSEERVAAGQAAARADQAAGRADGATAAATMTYWLGLKAALHPVPVKPEAAALDVGRLSTQGVDPDLVRQGQLVAEKMRATADAVRSISAFELLFRYPGSRLLEASAAAKAAFEQCRVVEGLRPELAARYGVEFPTLDVPSP